MHPVWKFDDEDFEFAIWVDISLIFSTGERGFLLACSYNRGKSKSKILLWFKLGYVESRDPGGGILERAFFTVKIAPTKNFAFVSSKGVFFVDKNCLV